MGHKKNGISKDLAALLKDKSGIMLDIGCGDNKRPGYVGIDVRKTPAVDIVQDLEVQPWPLPNNCVQTAIASHVLEHINPAKFGFVNFMNEVWRIMKPGGQFMIVVPYAGSQGYYQDPTHCNPINEVTWAYFDPMDRSGFWNIYKPKPWHREGTAWRSDGNIEIAMRKRSIEVPKKKRARK